MIGEGFSIPVRFHPCAKLAVSAGIPRCVNPFRTDSLEPGTENLRGFSVPDRLEKNFTIKGVNAHAFTDELCKSPLPLGIHFAKNTIAILCPCSFNLIHKTLRCALTHTKIAPVWTIADKKQVSDNMILVQRHRICCNTIITDQIISPRIAEAQRRQQRGIHAFRRGHPVSHLSAETDPPAGVSQTFPQRRAVNIHQNRGALHSLSPTGARRRPLHSDASSSATYFFRSPTDVAVNSTRRPSF
ncbi:hypothetical protein SCA50_1305 [Salmonella enterica subsp. enterica serovar Choleraesuis str. SCSA50]|uniref:Uncharacterized protein n=1 Tax=Salmonella enterica subsp. enterica serovar Choleraesuis str. SCSA50 TaxID=904139 RepID=A0AAJ8WVD8_SALET|nr:hypothetical protein SCA50_1305 [Salmonella enterica subsp. enterica serovar Choleraesuis str. SCSA50]